MSTSKLLTATNFSDMSGEEKSPETNEQKLGKFTEATKNIGDGQKKVSFGLQNSVEPIVKSISGNRGNTEGYSSRYKQRLSNIEHDLSSAKQDASRSYD